MNQKQALPLPEAPLRQRLADVRDIYTERSNASLGSRISMAEGGCFLPPPVEVLKGFVDAAANLGKFPHQIYPQDTVLPEFIDAIQTYFTRHCGIPLNEEEDGVVFGFGSSYIFDMLLSVICEPGDIVLMPESYYHSFAEWPEKWQAHAHRICTSLDNGYKLTALDLENWFKANRGLALKAKCLVLTSPTTTGAIYSREELESLSQIVNRHGLYLYCDEVFRDTVFSGKPVISAASVPSLKNRTITSTSGSKSRSVADLRIGWACGPKDIIDRMIWHMEHSVTEIPLYLQAVGTRIIRDIDDKFLQDAASEYQQRVYMIADLVDYSNKRLNLHFGTMNVEYIGIPYMPEAGHYICLDFQSVQGWISRGGRNITTGQDLCRHMYYHHHVNEKAEIINHGVCLSSGHSKGHDNFIMYMAFAQPGYEMANAVSANHTRQELLRHMVTSFVKPDATENQLQAMLACLDLAPAPAPDFKGAAISGQREIIEAFDRIVCALKDLKPAC